MSRIEKNKRGKWGQGGVKKEKSDNVFLTKFYLEKKKTLKAFSNLNLKWKGRDFSKEKKKRKTPPKSSSILLQVEKKKNFTFASNGSRKLEYTQHVLYS